MAGKPQWTSKTISISSSITSGKGLAYGVAMVARGTTVNSVRLVDGVAGTTRFSWQFTKKGVNAATANSVMVMFPTPILFSSKIICSIGAAASANKSVAATVFYRDFA